MLLAGCLSVIEGDDSVRALLFSEHEGLLCLIALCQETRPWFTIGDAMRVLTPWECRE